MLAHLLLSANLGYTNGIIIIIIIIFLYYYCYYYYYYYYYLSSNIISRLQTHVY